MALTREFKETVQARARTDLEFREALLKEAIDAMLAGEMDLGKAVLRDYIFRSSCQSAFSASRRNDLSR